MKVCSYPYPKALSPTVVALGCFDGTHVGHAALFAETVKLANALDAVPAVFTFSDFLPSKGTPLSTLDDRLAVMEEAGVETVFLSPFHEVKALSATDFIRTVLKDGLGALATVCGFNYRFGAGATGDGETLKQAFPLAVQVPAVTYGDAPISSSRIRAALTAGEVEEAAAMLGRPYTVRGEVSHGKSVGRAFGFPTANLAVSTLLPAYGVYETRVTVDGVAYAALSDVGVRPTVEAKGEARVESFLLDFEGDLYGRTLSVSFLRRLRDEMRFDGVEALRAQIEKDVKSIRSK